MISSNCSASRSSGKKFTSSRTSDLDLSGLASRGEFNGRNQLPLSEVEVLTVVERPVELWVSTNAGPADPQVSPTSPVHSSSLLTIDAETAPDDLPKQEISLATNASPLAPELEPLADNGGSTLTHAPLPGSPVINAGNPNVKTHEEAVLEAQPSVFWKLDELSGTTVNDVVGNVNGTSNGGVTLGVPGAGIGTGLAMDFDGVDGFVEGSLTPSELGERTILSPSGSRPISWRQPRHC